MASKYLQKYPVPAGFQEILADLTRQILRDQPQNIIEYAAKYFEQLEKGKKLSFDSQHNVRKDEKKYQLNYNPKNAQQITKKATNIATSIQVQTSPPQEVSKQSQLQALINKEFDQIDADKNGYLDSKEIEPYLIKMIHEIDPSIEVPKEAVINFMEEIDTNRDMKISRQQFLEFAIKFI